MKEIINKKENFKGVFVLPSFDNVNEKRLNENSSHRKRNKKLHHIEVLRFHYDGTFHSRININKDICERYGFNYRSIMSTLNPNSEASVSYKGLIWIRKSEFTEEELQKRVAKRKSKQTIKELGLTKRKSIVQIDIHTKEVVKIYPSIISVENEGYNVQCVYKVLAKNRLSYLDCMWDYYDNSVDYTKEYIDDMLNKNRDKLKYRGRHIQEIDINTGEVVNTFRSIASCARESKVKVSESTIRKILKGDKESFKGYAWKVC